MPKPAAEFDLVLYGASGFTGALVAEYLAKHGDGVRWAIAGRNAARLGEVAHAIGMPDLPVVVAEADDEDALRAMVARTRLVVSTAGPYSSTGRRWSPRASRRGPIMPISRASRFGRTRWSRRTMMRRSPVGRAS